MFWHYECNKWFVFAKFKTCIFEKWPKCGRNPSFFSKVLVRIRSPDVPRSFRGRIAVVPQSFRRRSAVNLRSFRGQSTVNLRSFLSGGCYGQLFAEQINKYFRLKLLLPNTFMKWKPFVMKKFWPWKDVKIYHSRHYFSLFPLKHLYSGMIL